MIFQNIGVNYVMYVAWLYTYSPLWNVQSYWISLSYHIISSYHLLQFLLFLNTRGSQNNKSLFTPKLYLYYMNLTLNFTLIIIVIYLLCNIYGWFRSQYWKLNLEPLSMKITLSNLWNINDINLVVLYDFSLKCTLLPQKTTQL